MNPKARTTMPIFTAQTQTDKHSAMHKRKNVLKQKALVLTELIIVIFIIGLMASIAVMNFPAMVARRQFESQAHQFIDIIKKAITASAEGGKRYAIILDFDEQTYVLKEITQLYEEVIHDEQTPTMITGYFTEQCQLDYVIFDDGFDSREPLEGDEYLSGVSFYTGKSGFDLGGHIILIDYDGNPYSIILNRLSRTVELLQGEDYEIAEPIYKHDLPF